MKGGYVYMLCSPNKVALYVGVTSKITRRISQHLDKDYPNSFTARYNCVQLIYFCYFDSITAAIAEEKRIKGWSRIKKERLIETINPQWIDLIETL